MLIYLILFGVAALFAVAVPRADVRSATAGEVLALAGFGLLYCTVAALRYEIGGDWFAYLTMFDRARLGTLSESLVLTDPAFGLLLYISGMLGTGIYLINGICAAILFYGIVRASSSTREPWLAITVAVPYLMIVVGMGYVRQAAAIGFILLAVESVHHERPGKAVLQLGLALLFHSTSMVVWPLFAMALANRNKLRMLILSTAGTAVLLTLLIGRLNEFSAGYIESEYESGGALVRLLMGLVPSLMLLVNYRRFAVGARARSIWIGFALANVAAVVALVLSPSSTVVDRIALYFTGVQLVTFGSIGELLAFSARSRIILRVLVVVYALATLLVWLIYATHASSWVPYKSVLAFL